MILTRKSAPAELKMLVMPPLIQLEFRTNNLCSVQCILQVLRKQPGVRNEIDHDRALQDFWQEKGDGPGIYHIFFAILN